MSKEQKSFLVLAVLVVLITAAFFLGRPVVAGDLEPPGAPGPTMKTLDQIPPTWSQKLPVDERFEGVFCFPIPGGLVCPAVLDKETGLVWAKDANYMATNDPDYDEEDTPGDGRVTWLTAIGYCRNLNIANRKGWRLPTVEELSSLVDMSQSGSPKVPPGVFDNVQPFYYWSSTTYEDNTNSAWIVVMYNGFVGYYNKANYGYVWPVRGGN